MIELPVSFFANSVEITAEIWNHNLNKYSKCAMVFDTGADSSVLTKYSRSFARVCLNIIEKSRVQ